MSNAPAHPDILTSSGIELLLMDLAGKVEGLKACRSCYPASHA